MGIAVTTARQAKYGGRRAALDAREECYAKIEKVEKEKWTLRDCLVSEEREVWYGMLRYGTVWCDMVWCGVVWYGMVWCGVVWCGVVWCGVVWCGVVWCGVVWCGVVWHVMVWVWSWYGRGMVMVW